MAVGTEPFAAKSVRWVNDIDLVDGVFLAFELDNIVCVPRFDECDIPDREPLGQRIHVDCGQTDGFAGLWAGSGFAIHPATIPGWMGLWRSKGDGGARVCDYRAAEERSAKHHHHRAARADIAETR